MNHIIYVIKDPDTNEVRYVGKSTHGQERFKEHMKPFSLSRNNHKSKWLKSLINKNKKPIFEIIATANNDFELSILERHYIKEYRHKGCKLTNATDGGEGSAGRILSEETKKKISLKQKEYHAKVPFIAPNKNHHKIINGITCKHCPNCDQNKELNLFGRWKRNWDGLNHVCRSCHWEREKQRRLKLK